MKTPQRSPLSASFDTAPRRNLRAALIFVFLTLLTIASYWAMIGHNNSDLEYFVLPWVYKIRETGIANFLAGSDYNYTPPYIYLLYCVSSLPGPENSILYVKLLSIAGTGLLCISLYRLLSFFMDKTRAWLCAVGIFILPTVAVDSVFWGQCDAIYTAAVVLAIAEALRSHYVRMMLALGVAFAFKAQAIFIFPFALYFLLSRKTPVWTLLIPAGVYGVLMIPAWMAGRPLGDLLTIYIQQADYYNMLSLNAPNPWMVVQYHLHGILYKLATPVGVVVGLSAGVALAWSFAKKTLEPRELMELAVASVVFIPFLLPRMHDRYFFPADVLCYAFAFAYPGIRTMLVAILVQLGSLFAYCGFLTDSRFVYGAHFGAVLVGLAVLLIGYQWLKSWSSSTPNPASDLATG
jgi:Gpi18-like mannosyltransferase